MAICKIIIYLFIMSICLACKRISSKNAANQNIQLTLSDSLEPLIAVPTQYDTIKPKLNQAVNSDESTTLLNQAIHGVTGRELVYFAKTLVGIPYRYASIDPLKGFDCSGFITYVFNNFNISVPRSSIDFTNVGKTIAVQDAKAGDLILFTGTVDSIRLVGHMGIITENTDTLKFIHSTSGKAYGVTISSLNEHYKPRFVKIIRVFN